VQPPSKEDVMSQTSDPGTNGAAAGESPTDEVAERSTDDRQSGGAAGTRDAQPSGTAREAAADEPETVDTDQRTARAAEEVEQDDRAGADEVATEDRSGDRATDDQVTDTRTTDDRATDTRTDDQTRDDQTRDDQTRDDQTRDDQTRDDEESEAERQKSAEEFAAQHDPDKHDVDDGEEFRQPGDWVADEQGPQEWDEEGNLVSGGGPGSEAARRADAAETDQSGASDPSGSTAGSDRRVSELGEVRDGGYSVGSAATIDDGAMPLGHPVKGWEDTKSYLTPDHPGYGDAEPHVWFTDPEAAERAGFHRAD
jgi:hypothetical protein